MYNVSIDANDKTQLMRRQKYSSLLSSPLFLCSPEKNRQTNQNRLAQFRILPVSVTINQTYYLNGNNDFHAFYTNRHCKFNQKLSPTFSGTF